MFIFKPHKLFFKIVSFCLALILLTFKVKGEESFTEIFPDAQELTQSYFSQAGWGTIYTASFPWVYLDDFGWLYVYPVVVTEGNSGSFKPIHSLWMWEPKLGWLWTSVDTFPTFYRLTVQEWYYWSGGVEESRIFFNFWTAAYQKEDGRSPDDFSSRALKVFDLAGQKFQNIIQRLSSAKTYPRDIPENGIKRQWSTRSSSDWTAGFFPAALWLQYKHTANSYWLLQARRWSVGLEQERFNISTHDVGFMIGTPFFLGYETTGDLSFQNILLDAAASLATRFNPIVGAIRSWSWGIHGTSNNFTVIIDNMMNLELLLRASQFKEGQNEWMQMAIDHACLTAQHLIRSDGTTYHLAIFDERNGVLRSNGTHQGYSSSSTWTRGQAWAIYGFTVLFRQTGDPLFLKAARSLARAFLERLPDDFLPPYDFDAPGDNVPADTSAGSVSASALIELSILENDPGLAQEWFTAAFNILYRLTLPETLDDNPANESLLLRASALKGQHEMSLIYGDFYFLEALYRFLETRR